METGVDICENKQTLYLNETEKKNCENVKKPSDFIYALIYKNKKLSGRKIEK